MSSAEYESYTQNHDAILWYIKYDRTSKLNSQTHLKRIVEVKIFGRSDLSVINADIFLEIVRNKTSSNIPKSIIKNVVR